MKKVVVIGDVIEDIIVISSGDRKLNTDNPSTIQSTPGGSGANFAVWLASLGVEVELIARVSLRDKLRLESYFRSKKVTPKFQFDDELETGRIVVLVEGNNRTFFTNRAANQRLRDVEFGGGDALYLSGYAIVSLGTEATQALIANSSRSGSMVLVDPGSSSFIQSFGVSRFLEAIQGANILVPNDDEYRVLAEHADLEQVFPEVVITRGIQGAQILGGAQVLAKTVELVDPTGAGDAFAASYLADRLNGSPPPKALERAVGFAAFAVTIAGGQP